MLQMIETDCFRDLNIFGPNGGPSPDLILDSNDSANQSIDRKRKPSFLARIFRKTKAIIRKDYCSIHTDNWHL